MPRFYMNIRHGEELVEDREGEEFSTLAEARSEAVLCARTSSRVPLLLTLLSTLWNTPPDHFSVAARL